MCSHTGPQLFYSFLKVFLKLDAKNYIKCGTFANMAKLI